MTTLNALYRRGLLVVGVASLVTGLPLQAVAQPKIYSCKAKDGSRSYSQAPCAEDAKDLGTKNIVVLPPSAKASAPIEVRRATPSTSSATGTDSAKKPVPT